MKKVFALLLVLVMVIGLCACGDKKAEKSPAEVAGRYYLVSAAENGTTYSLEEFAEMLGCDHVEMYIDLFADGTAEIYTKEDDQVETMEMGWGDGMMWPADYPDSKASCVINGDTITLNNYNKQMVFKKGESLHKKPGCAKWHTRLFYLEELVERRVTSW